MAIKVFNSINGFSVGENLEPVIDSNANITANILTVTANANISNLSVSGVINANGNISGANISTAGNIRGNDIHSNVNISANGNITANGNVTSSNATLGNLVTANFVAGTLTTAAQPNITSVGTLTDLTVTGNITSSSGDLIAQEWVAANTSNVANFYSNGGLNIYANAGFNVYGAGITSDGVVTATSNITASNATIVGRRFAASANGILDSGSGTNLTVDWSRSFQYFAPTDATNISVGNPPAAGLTVTVILLMPSDSYNVAVSGITGNRCSGGSTSFSPGTQRACHIIIRSVDTSASNCFVQFDATN